MKQIGFKITTLLMAVCCFCLVAQAQPNIVSGEYFFDADPGFGSGTTITISSPANNISSLIVSANTASLTNGMHTLFIRTKDANGKWSMTNSLVFAKVQSLQSNPNSITNINKMEYFYDTDPGFGSGTDIPVTANTNISGMIVNVDVSALSGGFHTLYIRSRDSLGKWSLTNSLVFAKYQSLQGNPNSITNINKMEYFYDTDPGFGSGTDIPVTANTNISGMIVNVDVSALSGGFHTLYIRSRDSLGKWSLTNSLVFAKYQPLQGNPNSITNINKMEYFYDTDPGFGSGTDIPVTANTNISGMIVNVDVSALSGGFHTLYIRSRDSLGKWSLANSLVFAKYQPLQGNPNSITNINKMEYFYDTDPGFGSGTAIPVTANTNISGMIASVNVTSLTGGLHTLYIRSRDSMGKWSLTNSLIFSKIQLPLGNPNTITNINKMEYFYDTDPGFGSGTNIPVTSGTNLNNLVVNVNVSSLSNGVHTLYVRSRDSLGKWSLTNSLVFAKVQPLFPNLDTIGNIVRVEYFVDTDPGFGNATSVTLSPPLSSNVMNLSFNVSMTTLNNGPHVLYVRSKDEYGKWSITNIHTFNGGTLPPLAIKLLSFDATLQQDKKVLLEWVAENEKDLTNYRIERSKDASNWVFVGDQKPNNKNTKNNYQLIDENPGSGIIYYRLTAFETSGDKTTAPIRFVKIGMDETNVATVFPNPNDGKKVNISSTIFKNSDVAIDIITTDGKLYWSQHVNTNGNTLFTISNLNLPAATYYINLRSKDEAQSFKLEVIPSGL